MKSKDVEKRLGTKNCCIIDVRTPAEFESVKVEGVVNVPLDQVKTHHAIIDRTKDCEIIIICKSGVRSEMAKKDLQGLGYTNAVVMDGGMDAWEEDGLPVIKGKQTMSLERQVRIAAGFLVFSGTLLGLFVNSGFFAIPAFVGAGLMFAGITNTCAMGMMIAKFPWNTVRASCKAS